jgi:hypothetical protein
VPFVKLWPGVGEDFKRSRTFGITRAIRRKKEGSQIERFVPLSGEYLLADPAIYKRLQAEVVKFFGPGESVNLEFMHDMPYLEACM